MASTPATTDSAAQLFVACSVEKIKQMDGQIDSCLQQLTDDQIWLRSGDNANAIGNLVLHLAGNIRQWIGHGVGGLEDIRERDKEFSARGGRSTSEILQFFHQTVNDALAVINAMPLSKLTARTVPQGREVSVLQAIYQVVGHLQLHTGQIIFATKQFTGKDLGFYKR